MALFCCCWGFLVFGFWFSAFLVGVAWYVTAVLVCVSLMAYDGERLFVCLLLQCQIIFFKKKIGASHTVTGVYL